MCVLKFVEFIVFWGYLSLGSYRVICGNVINSLISIREYRMNGIVEIQIFCIVVFVGVMFFMMNNNSLKGGVVKLIFSVSSMISLNQIRLNLRVCVSGKKIGMVSSIMEICFMNMFRIRSMVNIISSMVRGVKLKDVVYLIRLLDVLEKVSNWLKVVDLKIIRQVISVIFSVLIIDLCMVFQVRYWQIIVSSSMLRVLNVVVFDGVIMFWIIKMIIIIMILIIGIILVMSRCSFLLNCMGLMLQVGVVVGLIWVWIQMVVMQNLVRIRFGMILVISSVEILICVRVVKRMVKVDGGMMIVRLLVLRIGLMFMYFLQLCWVIFGIISEFSRVVEFMDELDRVENVVLFRIVMQLRWFGRWFSSLLMVLNM